MSLRDILQKKKDELLASWFDRIVETYPSETAKFIRNQKDRFANPVGQAIHEGLEGILDELVRGAEVEKVTEFLDSIIRVRAIQDFSAAGAVSFIFFLKGIIRTAVRELPLTAELAEELFDLDAQIDSLTLLAFDIFMQCREKLYDIKANETRNMTYRLLQQANLLTETKAAPETNFISIPKKEVNT